ncbi:claudin-9-like [Hippoglossus hippoglossus]|uniref:claudin-9-like n=1 Tax=Hippoglossus hippoglossus TaxID=8267 RepID=UPI00148C74AD|nr:claudin-9-like [Hippoglossus hippoglossus]XP_034453861.1 claudin-9-like [Hippoglossus hippoglossus]XP_035001541.1 claudin-9 [Hippoglossus stenolepis]XP_035001550.1 claudin-9 [Hippoglossus stenolepis]
MASTGLQLLGLILTVLGWVCGALVCAAPLWRVSAFVGGELVIAQVLWEGLWMNCLSQTTGQIQCKTYDSTLALPSSSQAARSLTVLSLLLCLLALMLGVAGAKGTHCMGDANQASKARLARLAGVLFLVAGLAYLIPICWTAYAIIRDFYDPHVAAPLKRELGPALYLGWGASLLLLVGGSLLHVGSSPPGGRVLPVFGGATKDNPHTGAAGEGKQPEKSFV